MYISKLCIRNYRNFKNSTLVFSKGINTIIGENGCGKTNIMQAIRILLDESLPRSYRFYETDFNRGIGNWKGHWIVVQIFFEELDHGDEAQALALHLVGDANKFDVTKGCCSVFFRPKFEIRQALWELSEDFFKDEDGLHDILSQLTLDDYEVVYTARSNSNFSDEEVYKTYVGDFDEIVFPNPSEQRLDIYGTKLYIANFTREVSCTFIKALRDVETDLNSYRDNPLINLLRGKERSIEIKTKNDIEQKVTELNDQISGLDEVKEVAEGVTSNIHTSVGQTYAPNVSIKSELPADMEKLMRSLKLWVGDSIDEPYLGKIWELSLGGANLIYLSTKLLEYEKVKAQDKIANFLLIEEPEAHIHTHIQKTLFEKIPEGRTQVIISTHSTHISSVSKISSVNILSKFSNYAEVYRPSNGLDRNDVKRIERYLDAVRSNLLFAKGVILVEGDAEQILIPTLFKKIFGVSLDEIGISLINIGSTGFQNVAQLFHEKRIRKNCAIVTDLDTSIVPLPAKKDDDTEFERDCRNSQIKGLERKEILDAFTKGNPFVKTFYAKNTFEVQFIEAKNRHEVCELVKKIYQIKKHIDDSIALINDTSLAVSGKEMLRLANKSGKGWFALALSEIVDHRTYLPPYILDAIKFAAPHLNHNIALAMAKKRLNELSRTPFKDDENDYNDILEKLVATNSIEELRKALKKNKPNGQLTKLLS